MIFALLLLANLLNNEIGTVNFYRILTALNILEQPSTKFKVDNILYKEFLIMCTLFSYSLYIQIPAYMST